MFKEFDLTDLIIKELNKSDKLIHHKIKKYMENNRYLCNDILYNDPRFKESTIIVSHILSNLSVDLIRQISKRYSDET